MKLLTILFFTLVGFMSVAFAQVAPVGDLDLISGLINIVKELKGASTLVIIAGIIQAFLLFSRSAWSSILGKYKIAIIALVSFIGVLVTGLVQDSSWATILTDASTLTAFQVLLNQVFKQIGKKD